MEYGYDIKKEEKKKPRPKAVAIKYEADMEAPEVVAKGTGITAEHIIEAAGKAGVETYKNAGLVEELSKIELGANIPPELYETVAQILIFVSNLDKLQGYRDAHGR